MCKNSLFVLSIFVASGITARATTYFVSPDGNDASSGTSPAQPFKTLERVNQNLFIKGDKILLKGGSDFSGNLKFDLTNAQSGLEIGSYGQGKAVIHVPAGRHGIVVQDLGQVKISGFKLIGSGIADEEKHNGIEIVNKLPGGKMLAQIEIDDIEVSDFGFRGIYINSTEERSGFRDVKIARVIAHHNWHCGIETRGRYPDRPHENIIVTDSKAYSNPGVSRYHNWTGSGIVVSGAKGGRIEYCEAWDNGGNCDAQNSGGPLGIWVWDVDRFLIQFNKSHHNHTKNMADGGGFDFDGGTSNSLMQFNYSADNDGYGYELCEFGSYSPNGNNVIRYNVSVRDGNLTGWGTLYVARNTYNTVFEHNLTYSAKGERGSGFSISVDKWTGDNIAFRNNILYAEKDTPSIAMTDSSGTNLLMNENTYLVEKKFLPIRWNEMIFRSFDEWRAQTGHEKDGRLIENMKIPAALFENVGKKERLAEEDFLNLEKLLRERISASAKRNLIAREL